jgi:hypothetical protein
MIQVNSPGHIHRPGEFYLPQLGEIYRERQRLSLFSII